TRRAIPFASAARPIRRAAHRRVRSADRGASDAEREGAHGRAAGQAGGIGRSALPLPAPERCPGGRAAVAAGDPATRYHPDRPMKVLVTGAAGFIGFHVARRLVERGDSVTGFDSVNAYYDPRLKERRLEVLAECAARAAGTFSFIRADLADTDAVNAVFEGDGFDRVIHLAAQAGVRHSLTHPHEYIQSNIVGFTNIIEACRHA